MFHHVKELQFPIMGEEWQYIDNPLEHVQQTNGLLNEQAKGTNLTEKSVQEDNKALSAARKAKVDKATLIDNDILNW
ncbi:MAG: hypothetical protein IT270_10450 [Saprospiraceae bacterium]|nr:hypothetical protein [Saprospiraceae bacterium]